MNKKDRMLKMLASVFTLLMLLCLVAVIIDGAITDSGNPGFLPYDVQGIIGFISTFGLLIGVLILAHYDSK